MMGSIRADELQHAHKWLVAAEKQVVIVSGSFDKLAQHQNTGSGQRVVSAKDSKCR
jgi:phosphoserine phosphatase